MPNSYDNVTQREWTLTTPLGKVSKGMYNAGGGTRRWSGSQSRVKPSCLQATACSGFGTIYFDTYQTWTEKNGNVRTGPASMRYGSYTEDSEESAMGRGQAMLLAESRLSRGNVNVLVALGEGPETVRFITNRVWTLVSAFNAIRNGNFQGAAKQLRSDLSQNASKRLKRNRDRYRNKSDLLANSWLEYQFAIRPLIGDVFGALEAYHANLQAGKNVRATARWTPSANGSIYRAGISGCVRSPVERTLQQLGITNPLLAAWNLIPLSFLVDWFVPISNYLSMMDSTRGLYGVSRWSSQLTWSTKRAKDPANSIERITSHYVRYIGTVGTLPLVKGSLPNLGQLVTATAMLQRTIR